jgi:hypothetical protein
MPIIDGKVWSSCTKINVLRICNHADSCSLKPEEYCSCRQTHIPEHVHEKRITSYYMDGCILVTKCMYNNDGAVQCVPWKAYRKYHGK